MPDPRKVLVWRNGFEEWEAAETVRELAEALFRPPPLRPTAPAIHSAEGPRTRGPAVTAQKAAASKGAKLEGIDGWLGLVAFGQVLGVLLLPIALPLEYWHAGPEPFLNFPVTMWGGVAMSAGLLALIIYTTILLFKKSRKFPRFFIYELMSGIFLPVIMIVWVGTTLSLYTGRSFTEFAILDPKEIAQWIGAVISAAIWIAYIKKSRRVANTFIK
jgi:Protein of unknown function (DUF2569)